MKKNVTIGIFALLSLVSASARQSKTNSFVSGTVVRVQRHETDQPFVGSNPSDAPLPPPETYAYDVAIDVNCRMYVGRYENWYDYLPSALRANQKVDVRLTRGAMFVESPDQPQMRLEIVSRQRQPGKCSAGGN